MILYQLSPASDPNFLASSKNEKYMLAVYPEGIGCVSYELSDGETMIHAFRFPALLQALARFKIVTKGEPWRIHLRPLPTSISTRYPLLHYYVFCVQHSPRDLFAFHPGVEKLQKASALLIANPQLCSVVLPDREVLQPKPMALLGRRP